MKATRKEKIILFVPVQEASLGVEQDRLELVGQSDRVVGPASFRSGFRFVRVGLVFVGLEVFEMSRLLPKLEVVIE